MTTVGFLCMVRGDIDVAPFDDDETANQDRGDDLDRTEADRGQPTLAPGTPDGPVGHDHGGAPSEPESATQSDPASAPPGRAPTTEVAS